MSTAIPVEPVTPPRRISRWIVATPPNAEAVTTLAERLQIPEEIANLLLIRKHEDPERAMRFLRPRREQLRDALTMKGAEKAIERLARATVGKETVLVHGDYDVDGICSTTILTQVLNQFGANAIPFIPNRLRDGYDLGTAGVQAATDANATLVVTCDCGTTAVERVADLCHAGIDVIITDHHLPGEVLPDCFALLNPNQDRSESAAGSGERNPDEDLAAVGVAFKVALALAKKLEQNDAFIWRMLDLVALATIADVAPLTGENRILVRYGLRMMSETQNVGLRAMIRAAGLDAKPITAGRVGFILGPRLNAAGRIDEALQGVELLTTKDEHRANQIARKLEELNEQRQELDRQALDEAREMVAALDLDSTFGIVLAKEGWHPGVIGIVASRLVEEFGRPTVLIALDGDEGKGSGRSIAKLHLRDALAECGDLLTRFGGHRMAAGVTIARDQVEEFARRFNAVAAAHLTPEDLVPEIRIDLEVAMDRVGEKLEKILRHFEPFGIGNPTPVLVARNVSLAAPPKLIGRDGLKIRLSTGAGELEAIGWGMAPRIAEFDVGVPVDVAFRLERDEYKGTSRLQARIADIIPHKPNDN
ncbi:MAG: single-stranded-DNA-specific exonuclease RecJ [Gemmatimonadales bacterium]